MTCRTCRARTWSRRWWCSRTGWRARASTAGSASRAPAAKATSPRCTRSSPAASAGTWRSGRPPASLTCSAIPRPSRGEPELRQRKFAYPPNLVVIDGGPAQVAAAVSALEELGIDDIAVCGLAKRLEEVWLPGEDAPVILPRSSEGLYLLQRVRDEAHRFAITYHRAKRSKALAVSELDSVPGLGPARRATLLRHFGSVRRIAAATPAGAGQPARHRAPAGRRGPGRPAAGTGKAPRPPARGRHERRGDARDGPEGNGGQAARAGHGQPGDRHRDHHRDVGRGPEHGRQDAGRPGLVRHR